MSWQTLMLIGSGGFVGGILRVLSIEFIDKKFHFNIPIGVIVVNVIGSFLAGLLVAYLHNYSNESIKSFVVLGLLGGLTTYSTFAIESVMYINQIKYLSIYVLSSLIGSILFAYIGFNIGSKIYS